MTTQSSDGEVHTSHGILPSTARPEGRAIKGGGNEKTGVQKPRYTLCTHYANILFSNVALFSTTIRQIAQC